MAAYQTLSDLPIEVGMCLFALLCAWSLTSMTCFHALIITLAQTTNERVRGVYQYGGIRNPADRGCWRNWMALCCTSVPDSSLPKDFSAEVVLATTTMINDNCIATTDLCGGPVNGSDEVMLASAKEETVWPGWQYPGNQS